MTWPEDWPTVTVTVDRTAASPGGPAATGQLLFDTVPPRLPSAEHGTVAVGTVTAELSGGLATVVLAATDSLDGAPFLWRVTEVLAGEPVVSYLIELPAASSPVALVDAVYDGDLPAAYAVISGPQGLPGPKGDKGDDGGGGNYDPEGSAAAAQAAAEAYTDTELAAEVERADAAYDHTGAASTAAAAALVSAKAYADSGDATTLAAAKAYTDGHAGGGGVVAPPVIRSVRIVSGTTADLPDAPSWAVVVTSGAGALPAEPLQCSVPAAPGNRIRVAGSFMRKGSHFLDWVLLDGAGAISHYAVSLGSDHPGTPSSEGNPALYPSLSQNYVTDGPLFTVGAEHVNGDGEVVIGLAHQGSGSFLVYAYESGGIAYPFALRLENIDQTEAAP